MYVFWVHFPERQTCKDFSGTDINLDSDWLAQKIPTKMKCQQRCRTEFYIVHDTALEEIHLLTNQSPPFATLCRVASKADIRASFIQNSQEMSCETSFVLREKGSLFCESKKRNCNVKRKNSVHLKLKYSSFTVKAKSPLED